MSPAIHKLYIGSLVTIVILVTLFLIYNGSGYYFTSLEERFYHTDHKHLKPSGIYGHGLGIIGTLLILFGVFGYMARKRFRIFSRIGILKHWLEFHIFLCTLGPIMILFHTAFKFGGIVSVSFWSMVAVVASGVVGRFIYLQIPRTIQGRELSLHEIHEMKSGLGSNINASLSDAEVPLDEIMKELGESKSEASQKSKNIFAQYLDEYKQKQIIRDRLKKQNLPAVQIKSVMEMVGNELALNRKIQRLVTMQKLFRYWHIAHLPFALIMLIIMVIHVAVTLTFGYKWIF